MAIDFVLIMEMQRLNCDQFILDYNPNLIYTGMAYTCRGTHI